MLRRRVTALTSRLPGVASKVREVASGMVLEVILAISLVVIFPITIRGLGSDQYGEYTTMYVVAGFTLTWVYAGGGAAVVQLILQRGRTTESALWIGRRQVTMLAVPAGLLGLAATYLILGSELVVPALLVFGSDLLIAGWAEMNISTVFAHRGVGATVPIRAAGPALRIVGVVALGLAGSVSIVSLVLVNLTANLLILGVSWAVVRGVEWPEPVGASGATTPRELLGLSFLYSTSISTNAVQNEGEKVILASVRPMSEVGEYQAAYRVVSASFIPLRAVHAAAVRWFLPLDQTEGGHVRKALLLTIPSAAYGIACAVGLFLVQPVVRRVLGEEFESAASITLWLCLLPLLHALAEVPTLGLLGLGLNRVRMYLGLTTSILAIVAYLALIPSIGWKGAVIGTYISELATITIGWWLLVRGQRRADLNAGA